MGMAARAVGVQGRQFFSIMAHLAVPFEITGFFVWIGRLKTDGAVGRNFNFLTNDGKALCSKPVGKHLYMLPNSMIIVRLYYCGKHRLLRMLALGQFD